MKALKDLVCLLEELMPEVDDSYVDNRVSGTLKCSVSQASIIGEEGGRGL